MKPLAGIFALLTFTGLVYWPALHGIFVLDDFENLKDLGEISTRGLAFYVFGGNAGPSGRPLSLLSFALQYQFWPADPFVFKLVNLLFHLINGALVFYVCKLITTQFETGRNTGSGIAYLTTGLWLLHPIQLSTVLYVVQRMTILSTMFILIGTGAYLLGRKYYFESRKPVVAILSLATVYLCMLLSILSKESGILMAVYILVLEFTLLRTDDVVRQWRMYAVPVLLLPVLVMVYYLFGHMDGFNYAYNLRDFTMGQRLLTEANILIDYLKLLFIPVSGAFSLFHDDYVVANGLFSPPRTLLSLLVLPAMLFGALWFRTKQRLISFAILWFFAGHLLESSFINLELYFEHRNYLPDLGIFMLISTGLSVVPHKILKGMSANGVALIYLAAIMLVTLMEISLWSQPLLQADEWSRQHPQSTRALDHLINTNLLLGDKNEAERALLELKRLDEKDIYPQFKSLTINACYEREAVAAQEWLSLNKLASTAGFRGVSVITELEYLAYMQGRGFCDALDLVSLSGVVDVLISNPGFLPVRGQLYDIAANLALQRKDADTALKYLNKALSASPKIDRKIFKVKILIAQAAITDATTLLVQIEGQLRTMPKEMMFYREQIRELKLQLAKAFPTENN